MALCFETQLTNVRLDQKPIHRLSLFGGRSLNYGESFVVSGDVSGWLAGKFPGIKGRRMIEKLENLIGLGYLEINKLPSAPCGTTLSSSFVVP